MGKDIAAGRTVLGSTTPVQLFAGEAPVITSDYENTIAVVKYGVYALDATGKIIAYDPAGTAPASVPRVVASQDTAVVGDRIAYFTGAFFNHEALVWPAGLTTFEARRAAWPVGPIQIGRLVN